MKKVTRVYLTTGEEILLEGDDIVVRKLRLINDSIEYVTSAHDFRNLVREHMGLDAAEYVEELITLADYNQSKVRTDLGAYEADLEEKSTALLDISDINQELIDIVSSIKRLDRAKIKKLLDKIDYIVQQH